MLTVMDGEGRNEGEGEEKGIRDTYIREKELGVFGLFRGSRHHGCQGVNAFWGFAYHNPAQDITQLTIPVYRWINPPRHNYFSPAPKTKT